MLRYSEDGQYKALSIGTVEKYPTKADAENAAASLRIEINAKTDCVRFHQLASKYEADELPARESTRASYLSAIRRLRDRWDDVRLDVMAEDTLEIENWLKHLQTLPTKNVPTAPMSKKSKRNIIAVLHVMFERAMQWKYLPLQRNPIDLVRVKGPAEKKQSRGLLTPQTLQALMNDEKLPVIVRIMCMVAMCTGLRASEILGLRWNCINFEAGTISVEASVVGKHEDEPKSDASQAEVPMHPDLAKVLREWQKSLPSVNGWVFANPVTGRPYWRDSMQSRYLRPAGKRIGLNDLGWHSFRHTYRAMMKRMGVPLELQQQLMRHSDIRMTMEYGKSSAIELTRPVNARLIEKIALKGLDTKEFSTNAEQETAHV